MVQLGQTITVVNKSGVIVKNSKQLIDIFREAKNAYREKKAELKASRELDWEQRRAHRALKHLDLEDNASRSSSRRHKHHGHADRDSIRRSSYHSPRHRKDNDNDSYYATPAARPPMDRGYTDSFYTNDEPGWDPDARRPAHAGHRRGHLPPHMEQGFSDDNFRHDELVRRHSDTDHLRNSRQSFDSDTDPDLAYGELPPPLPARRMDEEAAMRTKMTNLTRLLEEANCVQYSATAAIEHLQKNPDALASVALTLAEVSNIATKLAPGALAAMKGSFPAAMALLASPQFLIAAGLGVGVTVVMLGGYKIIKRIQEQKKLGKEAEAPLRLQELDPELSRIEMWRRGIADAEATSVGTTVDGEFITPLASQQLMDEGLIRPENIRASSNEGRRERRRQSGDKGMEDARSRASTSKSASRRVVVKESGAKRKAVVKGVKMLFQGRSVPQAERRPQ